jgi:hypothetical protein
MGIKTVFTDSTVARYARAIRASPREIMTSKKMLMSAALYAMAGVPISKSTTTHHPLPLPPRAALF